MSERDYTGEIILEVGGGGGIELELQGNSEEINLQMGDGSSCTNYNSLANKPAINHVTLIGDKSWEELGLPATEWGEIEGEITRQNDLMEKLQDQKAQALEVWEIERILYIGE